MTNLKLTVQIWKLSKIIYSIAFIFWLFETVYFLIYYGWHLRAINDSEKLCDNIFLSLFAIGVMLTTFVIINVLDYLLSKDKSLTEQK
jgi:heme/copper-type cytochrome/quinol oxidase subunit 2